MTKNFYYSYFPQAIIKSFTALAIILSINTTAIAIEASTDPRFTAPGSSYLSPAAPDPSYIKTDKTSAPVSNDAKTDQSDSKKTGPDAHISSDFKPDKGPTPTTPTPPSSLKNTDKGLGAHISSDFKSTEPEIKKDKEKDLNIAKEKTEITENELQNIIKNLPEKDKTVIHNIQKQISGWPKEVFSEIRNYNEFIMTVSQQAETKYNKLSPEAREALETENNLRKELSKEAIDVLAKLHIDNSY